ncbi:MAG: putative bifunctional diguanylate cyclase/phosphodiesterase [Betaproteobacteria bacterium]
MLRWTNPDLGSVSPAQFIPIAEETGLIIPIGAWVLHTACAQLASWRRAGHDVDVAVNLSPRQFRQKDLVEMVASALSTTGLAAQHLELEITEGAAMSRAEHTVSVLGQLHRLGVKLAVDDFGTGYSNLSYLKRFPLHNLKIDRSFIVDIGKDAHSEAIVPATVALAHSLGLKVVAEGVETELQRDFLASAGCDEAQGFLYGGAVSPEDFTALLR